MQQQRGTSGNMKKNHSGKRTLPDSVPPPDKVGWIRKFCGKGIFREIWKNRFLALRGDQLFVCEKEVKELGRAEQVLDLSDYERCEDVRKNKSRSKKNHSKFRLLRCSSPGNMAPNLVFLAVSPEEKESWINVLSGAITRAKNRILDEVTVDDSLLSHMTRDRVKIPHNRRLPTRGHLLAVASTSSSDGALTLDLIQEEDSAAPLEGLGAADGPDRPTRSRTDGALALRGAEASGKSRSLPREAVVLWEATPPGAAQKNRCASMDHILTCSDPGAAKTRAATTGTAVSRLQRLIDRKLEETEQLLAELGRGPEDGGGAREKEGCEEGGHSEAHRLLQEARLAWTQAQEVLEEVKNLRALCQQLDPSPSSGPSPIHTPSPCPSPAPSSAASSSNK